MSENLKLKELKSLLGYEASDTSEDNLLNVYLQIAEQKVINRLYPFKPGSSEVVVPIKYSYKVVEIAQYLYLRRGSEGETSHSENGVSRAYESADVPKSMLDDIIPMVGAVI